MNILQVADVSIEQVIGGAERVLFEQSIRLARRGHGVSVLTRRLPSHEKAHAVIKGVYEFRYRVNTSNPVSYFYSTFVNGRRLFETLNTRKRFDAICFHQPFSAFAVCRSVPARKIKKIYTCHSLAFEEYISRNPRSGGFRNRAVHYANALGRKWMERYVLKRSEQIVVLSRYTEEKVRRIYGIKPEKLHVIAGGVDLERFSPADDKLAVRDALGIPDNRLILLTVRNLVSRMGLENLITAMSMLHPAVPEVHLVIGGTGPLENELTTMVRQYGLSSVISFAGFIPEDRLPDYYRMADLFVLPTKELEGFGLVTLEAMASGVPVVGTPTGGTNEILKRFDPGMLFDDISAEAMAALLKRRCREILADPDGTRDLARRCREFAAANFGWDAGVDALELLMTP